MSIREQVLAAVRPVVMYGLHELPKTSPEHAMYEVAAITFLMGKGYDYYTAHRIVEFITFLHKKTIWSYCDRFFSVKTLSRNFILKISHHFLIK